MRTCNNLQLRTFLLLSLLWFTLLLLQSPAGAAPDAEKLQKTETGVSIQGQDNSTLENSSSQPHLLWLIGEVSLGIITALLLLIVYSWHLRRVVNRKTRELKQLNSELEAKVQTRTQDLERSREEYRKMYNHAESERKRAQSALQAEQEAITQNLNFIDMLTHEYRTPLAILTSGLDIIERKSADSDCSSYRQQISKMRIASSRLIEIFESSLDRNQLNTLAPQLNLTKLKLSHLLDAAIQLVRSSYSNYSILLNKLPKKTIYINGDENLLRTVFCNILDNACKFSDPVNPVIINVMIDSGQLIIQISDQGQGINPDEVTHIFEKYYRSDQVGSKPGAGLGLFIVKKILTLHGGEITVKSELNIGTAVTVILPQEKE